MLVRLSSESGVILGTFTRVEEAQRFVSARDARMGFERRTVWVRDGNVPPLWRGVVEGTAGAEVRYWLEMEGK